MLMAHKTLNVLSQSVYINLIGLVYLVHAQFKVYGKRNSTLCLAAISV